MQIFIRILLLSLSSLFFSQKIIIERVEPAFWYTNFKSNQLQILVYGKNISKTNELKINTKDVDLLKINRTENPNYLFLDLEIKPNAKSQTFEIDFIKNTKKSAKIKYELRERNNSNKKLQGVNTTDLIYLIMPDRFANGNEKNDDDIKMLDNKINRDNMYSRHGGDLEGIISKLDYIKDLGVTAIWNTPEVENNMKEASYHGYAATDFYKIDSRFGSNEIYKKYVEAAHNKGIKIIKDFVPNHIGKEHWFMKDLPSKDWVHFADKYTNTSYRFEPLHDPYVSKYDKEMAVDGWFVPSMPDINQTNPLVEKYLTQNYLWWIETFDIDGIRIDTYSYNDPNFMANWVKSVKNEFPKISVFGETLMFQSANQAYFTKGGVLNNNLNTNLPGITDAVLKDAIYEALNGKNAWYDGVNRLYNVLSQDFLYQNPEENVIFLDNHDMSRFYSVVGEDMNKFKSGINFLLTLKKIPQMYYGTEVLMKNFSNPDGLVRSDMLGGWKEDTQDFFSEKGRTQKQNLVYNYIKTLANYRKNTSALQTGKMMHFYPKNYVYVYFRYDELKTVMIIYNANETENKIEDLSIYNEVLNGKTKARNIFDSKVLDLSQLILKPKESLVLEILP